MYNYFFIIKRIGGFMSSSDTSVTASSVGSSSSSALPVPSPALAGQLQGRYVEPANGFSRLFHQGIVFSTNKTLTLTNAALVEEYFADAEVLEPICYEPGMTFATSPKLNHVFVQTIPVQFPQQLQKDRARFGMQNMREIDTRGMLLSFITRHAFEEDAAEKIHQLFGRMVTEFAPKLQSLTLQREFNVQVPGSRDSFVMHHFDEALLKKYLPNHPKLKIQIEAALGQGIVQLDLENHRLVGTLGQLGIAFAQPTTTAATAQVPAASSNVPTVSSSSSSSSAAVATPEIQRIVRGLISNSMNSRSALSNFEVMLKNASIKETNETNVALAYSMLTADQQPFFDAVVEDYEKYLKGPLQQLVKRGMLKIDLDSEQVKSSLHTAVQMLVLVDMQRAQAAVPVAAASSSSSSSAASS